LKNAAALDLGKTMGAVEEEDGDTGVNRMANFFTRANRTVSRVCMPSAQILRDRK